ncbi:MAG: YjiH family protein [Tissierellia bacterium]|nr:YjiH family protein [Tissierellia bacterium]
MYKKKDILKFVIPSILGVLLLMMPFKYNGETTILVALLSTKVQDVIGDIIPTIVVIILYLSFILATIYKFTKNKKIKNMELLKHTCDISNFWYFVRLLAVIISTIIYFNLETNYIATADTGSLILYDLIKGLFVIFFFAGFLLPLLTEFGLLEYLGVFLTPVMRPLFNIPGRSAIDCVASWVGDGTIGISLTARQYELGYYSEREASIISTCFSAVSITFCIVILDTVGLIQYLGLFYLCVTLIGVIIAMILPKIYPLNRKEDKYYNGVNNDKGKSIPEGYTKSQYALKLAVEKAKESSSISNYMKNGLSTALEMWLSVLPSIMAFGTLALIVATFTPFFQYLGMPFRPLLKLMKIPEYQQTSNTLVVGFADMFLPAVMAESIKSEMTRFIVATISITQVLFMSETGAVILGSKIPVNLWEIFVIFIERTLISLPIVALFANFIF